MSLRDDYAWDRWVQCMQPATPDHPRILRGCPASILDRYYRSEPTGAWFLPGIADAWDDLPRWEELHPLASEDPVLKQQRAIEQFGREQQAWEARVRATDWGSDPNWWRPGAHLDASAVWYDPVRKVVRSPHRELMERYGTVSLTQYATWQGMPPPIRQL